MLLLVLEVLAQAACPADPAALAGSLQKAEMAFSALDADGTRAAMNEALGEAACLSAPIDAALAARLHRDHGLRAFIDGNEAEARLAFAAARAADSSYEFPEGLLPRNHPIRALYDAATTVPATSAPAPKPASGHLDFDGASSQSRPSAWPTVAELIDPSGKDVKSAYLEPGDALFPYPVATTVAASTHKKHGPSLPLAIVAGASLVAAGACYGEADVSYNAFWDPNTANGDLPGLQAKTNALFYGSVGSGILALGTGVGAVVIGHW